VWLINDIGQPTLDKNASLLDHFRVIKGTYPQPLPAGRGAIGKNRIDFPAGWAK
jgi:hypothetical protein